MEMTFSLLKFYLYLRPKNSTLMRFGFCLFLLLCYSTLTFGQIESNGPVSIKPDTLSIIGVGDIMMGTNYPENKLPPSDGNFLLKEVEPVLKNAETIDERCDAIANHSNAKPSSC